MSTASQENSVFLATFFLFLLLSFCAIAQPASAVMRLPNIPSYAPVEKNFFKAVCVLRSGPYIYAFTYDSRNRNISVAVRGGRGHDVKTFHYTYNAMGQRVAKAQDSAPYTKDGVHFIYDQHGNLIAERGNGGWKDYIYVDNLPVAMIDNNQVYYIHTDHLGAPQKMTDDRQRIIWNRIAEPFGETAEIRGPATLNLRFPGQYHDAETGLDYNLFRSYNPKLGRYTQSDPIGLAGGINTYGYVGQNPVNLIDPWGLAGIGHNGGPPLNDAVVPPNIARLLNSTALGLVLFFQSTPVNVGEDQALQLALKQSQGQGQNGQSGGQCTVVNPTGTQQVFNYTNTVENNAGNRPYINSPLLTQQIMQSEPAMSDPQGTPGFQYWNVPGSYNQSNGSYELVYDPATNTIVHFQYSSSK